MAKVKKNAFGESLKDARKAKNLTQTELGVLCGLHQCQISGFESGRLFPSRRNAKKLANALGISLSPMFLIGDEP